MTTDSRYPASGPGAGRDTAATARTDGRPGSPTGTGDGSAASPTVPAASPPPARELTRVVLRPIGSSVPLAFFGFATGTILYTAAQLHWIPQAQDKGLGILLLAFSAPLQLLAGLIAYAARDTGLATVVTVLSASWACIGITTLVSPPGGRTALLGIFVLCIALVLAITGAAAAVARPLVAALALFAVGRYALTGVYELTGNATVQEASGWIGVPLAAISFYGGTAFLLEETARRTVLPLGRRRAARAAVEGDFREQTRNLGAEAGVRQQL